MPSSSKVVAERGTGNFGPQSLLDFDPARDGFGFANLFTWTEEDLDMLRSELGPLSKGLGIGVPALVGRSLGGRRGLLVGLATGAALSISNILPKLVGGVARKWPTFGLCGGMALLAKERWERTHHQPTSELHREALRPILRLYQARTIRASWPRFLKYWLRAQVTPGVFSVDELDAEAEIAMAQIDAGRLAILGLVGDAPDPFATHQVVAFGYDEALDRTDFYVYDPNAPGRTRRVVIREKDGKTFIETDLPTGPKKEGGYHISKTTGSLSMMFVVPL